MALSTSNAGALVPGSERGARKAQLAEARAQALAAADATVTTVTTAPDAVPEEDALGLGAPGPVDQGEVQSLALSITQSWRREEDRRMMERARAIAADQLQAERQAAWDADPEHWRERFARAGVAGVVLTWGEDTPTAVDMCVSPDSGFAIGPEGVFFLDAERPDAPPQFVCSPVLMIGSDGQTLAFSAKVNGRWEPVAVAAPPRGASTEMMFRPVLLALQHAGVTFGKGPILRTVGAITRELEVAEAAISFLFGYSTGFRAATGSPIVRLAVAKDDRSADAKAGYPAGTDMVGRSRMAAAVLADSPVR